MRDKKQVSVIDCEMNQRLRRNYGFHIGKEHKKCWALFLLICSWQYLQMLYFKLLRFEMLCKRFYYKLYLVSNFVVFFVVQGIECKALHECIYSTTKLCFHSANYIFSIKIIIHNYLVEFQAINILMPMSPSVSTSLQQSSHTQSSLPTNPLPATWQEHYKVQ